MAYLATSSWFAAQVAPRSEKRVASMLSYKGYEQFCPTYTTKKKWSDRQKEAEEPLFPGYVFVRAPSGTLGGLLCSTPGVVRILSFGGRPAVLPDAEIDAVMKLSARGKPLPTQTIYEGETVRVCDGPFAGITGIVQQIKDKECLVFRVQMISQSIYVEVNGCDLERVSADAAQGAST